MKNFSHGVLRILVLSLAIAIVTCLMPAAEARATCCPTYYVEIMPSFTPSCRPVTVTVNFSTGLVGTNTYSTNGLYTETCPLGTPCWGAFTSLVINGTTVTTTWVCPSLVTLACGTFTLCMGTGPNGCMKFTLS
jgi:hypothetical protein